MPQATSSAILCTFSIHPTLLRGCNLRLPCVSPPRIIRSPGCAFVANPRTGDFMALCFPHGRRKSRGMHAWLTHPSSWCDASCDAWCRLKQAEVTALSSRTIRVRLLLSPLSWPSHPQRRCPTSTARIPPCPRRPGSTPEVLRLAPMTRLG